MGFSVAYGKLWKGAQTILRIHVAPFGHSGSLYLQDRDAPDSGVIPNSQYFKDPAFTPGNEAAEADKVFINGEYAIPQSTWRTKSNGDYRLDFFPVLPVINNVFAAQSSAWNNKENLFASGNYGDFIRDQDIGGATASISIIEGHGQVIFSTLGFRGGGNKDFRLRKLMAQAYSARFSRTNIFEFDNIWTKLIETQATSNDLAGFMSRESVIYETILNHSANGQSSGRASFDSYWGLYNSITGRHLWATETSPRNYLKSSSFSNLNGLQYSNNNSQALSTGPGNVDGDPKYNSDPAGDLSVKLDTVHMLDGAPAPNQLNIANSFIGKAHYKADGVFNGIIETRLEGIRVLNDEVTLLIDPITVKVGDTFKVVDTTDYNGTYTVTADATDSMTFNIVDSGITVDNGLQSGTFTLKGDRQIGDISEPEQLGTWSGTEFFETTIDLESEYGAPVRFKGLYLPSAPTLQNNFNHLNKEPDGSLKLY